MMSGERPLIAECKQLSNRLSTDEINQTLLLFRVGAKIGILTNGVIYKFFTDEAEANKMDEEPFWRLQDDVAVRSAKESLPTTTPSIKEMRSKLSVSLLAGHCPVERQSNVYARS